MDDVEIVHVFQPVSDATDLAAKCKVSATII